MNRLLPEIMRPLTDEVLSSWLHRGSRRNRDLRFDKLLSLFHANNILDPDQRDSAAAAPLLAKIFGQPVEHFISLFPAKEFWVMPLKHRSLYCSQCIIEDVFKGYLPAYRKSWMYRWSIICPVHVTVLDTIERKIVNSKETMQLALHQLAKNELTSSLKIKPSISTSKYSTHAGFLNIAYYFQEWLFRQSKKQSVIMPDGHLVDAVSFFNMVDILCLSIMRPATFGEERVCQAYSYLPPRKWPTQQRMGNVTKTTVNRDIGTYGPIEKAGFFSYLGLLVGVPKCCQLWRMLGNSSALYCCPDSRSLFPDDDRNLRGRILERLAKENNPLHSTVRAWFDIDLAVSMGMSPIHLNKMNH